MLAQSVEQFEARVAIIKKFNSKLATQSQDLTPSGTSTPISQLKLKQLQSQLKLSNPFQSLDP